MSAGRNPCDLTRREMLKLTAEEDTLVRVRIQIPQVRHLDFYPRSLERGCRSEKALKLAIAEMYVRGVSTRKGMGFSWSLGGLE